MTKAERILLRQLAICVARLMRSTGDTHDGDYATLQRAVEALENEQIHTSSALEHG